MNNKDLLYIEDTHKKKLFYRFTPAAIASNFVPLIVILGDEGKTQAPHFEYKMWNVLTPIYNFSDEKENLLQELISEMAEEHECEEHIYLYGSYGAILHGIGSNAHAVYVNIPQIRLEDIENNLSSFLNSTDSFPIFYLCNNADSLEQTLEDTCKKYGLRFHIDKCVKSGMDESHTIKEVLDMFERMNPES